VGAALALLPASAVRVRGSLHVANVADEVGVSNVTAVDRVEEAAAPPPRVFFLFLAVDKVSNLPVWDLFFKAAPSEQYRAYVHCKLDSCKAQVQGSALQPVATVPSYYCTDLVSPMNQLIATALTSDGTPSPADKFAFVSDSTLPAKPFHVLYSTLSQRRGSDFCVFPASEWADVVGPAGQLEVVPKAHQWITLERGHAEKLLADWHQGKWHDLMSRFRMNLNAYSGSNNSFADQRNWGCLDEFWHMAALYGPIGQVDRAQEKVVDLPLFVGAPLRVSASPGWQGECDTFVLWSHHLHAPGNNPFLKLYSSLDPKSVPHGGNFARPGWWDTITTVGLKAIRDSSFLFVRKFIDYPTLADGPSFHEAYEALVLKA